MQKIDAVCLERTASFGIFTRLCAAGDALWKRGRGYSLRGLLPRFPSGLSLSDSRL